MVLGDVRGIALSSVPVAVSGEVSRPDHADPWQPREPSDHAGVRLLRRVSAQVRLHHRVAILHGDV